MSFPKTRARPFQGLVELLGYIQEVFAIFQPFLQKMINVPNIKLV